jgi:hypothetical protein
VREVDRRSEPVGGDWARQPAKKLAGLTGMLGDDDVQRAASQRTSKLQPGRRNDRTRQPADRELGRTVRIKMVVKVYQVIKPRPFNCWPGRRGAHQWPLGGRFATSTVADAHLLACLGDHCSHLHRCRPPARLFPRHAYRAQRDCALRDHWTTPSLNSWPPKTPVHWCTPFTPTTTKFTVHAQ